MVSDIVFSNVGISICGQAIKRLRSSGKVGCSIPNETSLINLWRNSS